MRGFCLALWGHAKFCLNLRRMLELAAGSLEFSCRNGLLVRVPFLMRCDSEDWATKTFWLWILSMKRGENLALYFTPSSYGNLYVFTGLGTLNMSRCVNSLQQCSR